MTSARPGRLRLGDRVRFQERTYAVVGPTGIRVRLADAHGSLGGVHAGCTQHPQAALSRGRCGSCQPSLNNCEASGPQLPCL